MDDHDDKKPKNQQDPPKPADPGSQQSAAQIPDVFKTATPQLGLTWPQFSLPGTGSGYTSRLGLNEQNQWVLDAFGRHADPGSGTTLLGNYSGNFDTRTHDLLFGANRGNSTFVGGLGLHGNDLLFAAGGKGSQGEHKFQGGLAGNTGTDVYALSGNYTNGRQQFDLLASSTQGVRLFDLTGKGQLGKNGNFNGQFTWDESLGKTALDFDYTNGRQQFDLLASNTKGLSLLDVTGKGRIGKDGDFNGRFTWDESLGKTALDFDYKNSRQQFDLLASRTQGMDFVDIGGKGLIGKDGNFNGRFLWDESLGKTQLNFDYGNGRQQLNLLASDIKGMGLLDVNGKSRLGENGNIAGRFLWNEELGKTDFNLDVGKQDRFGFGLKSSFEPKGSSLGLNGWYAFGEEGRFNFDYLRNGAANTQSLDAKLAFDKRNHLNFNFTGQPNGYSLSAESAFAFSDTWSGLANGKYNSVGKQFDANLGIAGPNLKLNGNFGINGDKPHFGANGSYVFDKLGSSVGANVSVDPNDKKFLAGVEISKMFRENEHLKGSFSIEDRKGEKTTFRLGADYTRDNLTVSGNVYGKGNDVGVGIGLTFRFGGGSSKSDRATKPAPIPTYPDYADRAIERAALPRSAAPLESQDPLVKVNQALRTRSGEAQQLFTQAKEKVEELNRNLPPGNKALPVLETAASLAVLAEKNGLPKIGYVTLGQPVNGQQNLFIGQESNIAARTPASDRLSISVQQATTTPALESVKSLPAPASTQLQGPTQEGPEFGGQHRR